jgi:DNA replication protein DnaC
MSNEESWQQCLQLIRQQMKDEWVFPTWFQPITCEHYDPQQHTLLLQVPSTYVYEFIEHYYVRLLQWAVAQTFGADTRIQYRIRQNADGAPVDFRLDASRECPHFQIPDAQQRLRAELIKHLGDGMHWLPAYDQVAAWLSDNRGRGLICIGTCGLGKTVICRDVLPAICQQTVAYCLSSDMPRRIDELLHARCVIIDDLGKEPKKFYGQDDLSFFRLCDAAERDGILLIVATNLSTSPVAERHRHVYPNSIQERYGMDVISRLRATTSVVVFEGPDLRGEN